MSMNKDKFSQPIDDVSRGIDYNTYDLNKLDDLTLQRHKTVMDKKYNENFVSKDNPDFQYDKRVDFSTQNNAQANDEDSWDEDEDIGSFV